MDYKLTFKEYNKSLKRGALMGLKCNDCGKYTCPPKMVCQECGSLNVEAVQLKGSGKVITFTVSYVPAEGRDAEVPYAIVMVELDEGPWLLGNLTDIDPNRITTDLIGRQVKLGPRMKSLLTDTYTAGNKEAEGSFARATFVFA